MADLCDLDRSAVPGLQLTEHVFKMEPIADDQDCLCVFETFSDTQSIGDGPKLTVTLRSDVTEIRSTETYKHKQATSFGDYRMNSAFDPKDFPIPLQPPRNKPPAAFSAEASHEHVRTQAACCDNNASDGMIINTLLDCTEKHFKGMFASKNKCTQPTVNESNISNGSLPVEISDNLHTAVASTTDSNSNEESRVSPDLRHHRQYEAGTHAYQTELHNDMTHACYVTSEDPCFAAEIQMICNHPDLFTESNTRLATASGSECFSDSICQNTALGFVRQSSCSDDFSCDLKSEKSQIYQTAQEDAFNDSYENIELSSIFSSTDIYQRSFDHNYNSMSPSQEMGDCCPNFITDLDSKSCERFMADSGVFGLSFLDSGSDFFQSDGTQYSQKSSLQLETGEDKHEQDKDSILLFKSESAMSTPVAKSCHANATLFPDPSTQQLNNVHTSCQEFHCALQHSSSPTATLSSAGLSFSCNAFDKAPSTPSFYDPSLNDYHRYAYHSPYSYTTASTECKSWVKANSTAYESPPSLISRQTDDICPVSSTDFTGKATKADIAQFIDTNAKDDEEETDDADEIDNLPVCFNTNSDYLMSCMGPQSAGLTEYQGDNSNTGYSPSVLTPPPSVSSTPILSTSQESTSDEMDMSAALPVCPYDTPQMYDSPTGQIHACKLKHEQLETSLLGFGLNQGTKRPYPSMADAMRSSRSKSATRKKCTLESYEQQPRRSGRPRKSQIQSDTISTTAVSSKQKKRMVPKSKCETLQDAQGSAKSCDGQVVTICSRMSGTSRHNEPLNQQAVVIMSRWFDDHIDNPYPSKADKENMAAQGGITENQVKSWFANKRNRTNNTKPKVQKRAMEEKLKEIFRDLKRNNQNPMADNSRVIQQLSGIIQHCHSTKLN